MNGLELSRSFYETHGRPMLEREFSDLLSYLAVGLFGQGSECFGYDDEISQDHDFEPGFCIFLPEESLIDRRREFQLERAYAKLPREFQGFSRPVLQPVGGPRRGVFRTADFFTRLVGSPNGVLNLNQWLSIPEQALAEATNGEIYHDEYGEVSRIRSVLSVLPEDVRLKRLAGNLLLMGQAGQYNYARCLSHGETAAAQLAAAEFVRRTLSAVFLLNRRYQPYYKWSFRALRELPALSKLAQPLEMLLSTGNDARIAQEKVSQIEAISESVTALLRAQSLTDLQSADLERHSYAVNDRIADAELRNMHILAAI